MTKLNLWDALKPTIILQRLYCISPFQRVGNLLKPSLISSIHGLVTVIVYYSLMVYSAYLVQRMVKIRQIFQQSYLWTVIAGFEILFNNVGFIVSMALCEFKKRQQLSFLNQLYDIDEVIKNDFRTEIRYKNLYLKNVIAVLLCLIYHEGLIAFVLYFLHSHGLTSFGLYLFAFLYQYEQVSSGTVSLSYINYVLLVRERFKIVKTIQIKLTSESTAIDNQSNVVKISKLFLMYKELCSLIELINDNYGIMLIIRIAHDFTLTTSQVYLISWVFMDSSVTNKVELITCVTLWMLQNIVKIGLTTMSTELTVIEALSCGHILDTHNRNRKGKQLLNLLDSFDHWLLHRKIEFTANNFFKVDLNLLYSIIGALATYTLILIQFKQQEESLAAESTIENGLNISAMYEHHGHR